MVRHCHLGLQTSEASGRTAFGVRLEDLRLKENLDTFRCWADEGHLPSMFLVALAYLKGNGVAKDNEKAGRKGPRAADSQCPEHAEMMLALGK